MGLAHQGTTWGRFRGWQGKPAWQCDPGDRQESASGGYLGSTGTAKTCGQCRPSERHTRGNSAVLDAEPWQPNGGTKWRQHESHA
eukprot:5668296-Alexandrium_andersonii.AAC.1